MTTTFNVFDIIFFVFTFIFVVSAFFRGLVKELFSLSNWIISLLLSYFLAPYASDLLAQYFDSRLVLEGLTRSVIFVISFITIALTTSEMRDSVQSKMPKLFDRSLGVLFGFVKTLLIFGFIYSLYLNVYAMAVGSKLQENPVQEPNWFKQSKSYSLIKFSGETLNPLVKKFFESISGNFDEIMPKNQNLDEKIEEIMEEKSADIENINPVEGPVNKDAGYNKKDIEKMNHLIDIIDK